MKAHNTGTAVTRWAKVSVGPFSTLIARGTEKRAITVFRYGGWNYLPADQCAEYPYATYLSDERLQVTA